MKMVKQEISENKEKILYCYNDSINSIENVIAWFVLYLGYTIEQAFIASNQINNFGKAPIYKGTDKELKSLSKILNNKGLETTIEKEQLL